MNRFRVKPACGTKSGYDWHVRQAEEEPCTLCREAHSLHWRKQRVLRGIDINARRRARAALYTRPTGADWASRVEEITDLYGTDCYICGNEIDYEAPRKVGDPGWELSFHPDHVVSLSRGGDDTIENIRPAHGYCNQKKWAK